MRYLRPFISQLAPQSCLLKGETSPWIQTKLHSHVPSVFGFQVPNHRFFSTSITSLNVKAPIIDPKFTVEEAISLIKSHPAERTPLYYQTCIKCVPMPISQPIQRTIILPHPCTKKIKILCFAEGKAAEAAKAAGADIVGGRDLITPLTNKELTFDLVLSTPESFEIVKTLGRVLGPMGLMPSLKKGTVVTDIAEKIEALKVASGYTCTKRGDVMMLIGLFSYSPSQVKENIQYLLKDLVQSLIDLPHVKSRPKKFISKVYLTAQRSPAFPLSVSQFELPLK